MFITKTDTQTGVVTNMNNKETVLCPVKGVNIYLWVCREKCTYHKNKKCPLEVKSEDWKAVTDEFGGWEIVKEQVKIKINS